MLMKNRYCARSRAGPIPGRVTVRGGDGDAVGGGASGLVQHRAPQAARRRGPLRQECAVQSGWLGRGGSGKLCRNTSVGRWARGKVWRSLPHARGRDPMPTRAALSVEMGFAPQEARGADASRTRRRQHRCALFSPGENVKQRMGRRGRHRRRPEGGAITYRAAMTSSYVWIFTFAGRRHAQRRPVGGLRHAAGHVRTTFPARARERVGPGRHPDRRDRMTSSRNAAACAVLALAGWEPRLFDCGEYAERGERDDDRRQPPVRA
jgi:hypothetical protein